jgi:hypothetical protein
MSLVVPHHRAAPHVTLDEQDIHARGLRYAPGVHEPRSLAGAVSCRERAVGDGSGTGVRSGL